MIKKLPKELMKLINIMYWFPSKKKETLEEKMICITTDIGSILK